MTEQLNELTAQLQAGKITTEEYNHPIAVMLGSALTSKYYKETRMRAITALFALSLLVLPASRAAAQSPAPPRPADVASVDRIIGALYDVISGPAGQARDWDRFRSLFASGARLIPAAPRPDGSAPVALSPDDYVQRTSDAFLKNGFFERAIANQTDAFGTIVHVFSTYESRRANDDEKPFARGINSIQVMQHAGRWWIVTVMWDQERPDNPIPAKYLERR